ncbi:ABC transporter permease [Streptomyces sp. NBC_01795]|uniref:ABC transporter permease n=1 Tax=Streptomyces sp. NBC_01795 TaxID=2975943 RepID=UPI002DD88EF6|nr:ABC transporter permease [Streptomyces sp. NBC_01795]WSA91358.1 ABC transporter permease [Streptomyces sp. NBC_01795]
MTTAHMNPASARPLNAVTHAAYLTARLLRTLWRMPAFLVIGLVQPALWLLLFGQLFRSVVDLPGFAYGEGGFLRFLTPGVVMMTALFASAWAGTTYLQDIDRGVMDRLLTSPVGRGAMMCATMAHQAAQTVVRCLIIVVIALIAGARFPGGVPGVGVTVLAAVLLTLIFSALSNAVALLTRQQATLIAISQFTTLPLMFLSSAVMDLHLAPGWVGNAARRNPVEWAVVAARQAMLAHTDWSMVWTRLGLLAAAALVMGLLATRAFRAYRKSM